jgi:hypothetical protein
MFLKKFGYQILSKDHHVQNPLPKLRLIYEFFFKKIWLSDFEQSHEKQNSKFLLLCIIAFDVKRVLHSAKCPNTSQARMTGPLTHTTRTL